MNNRKTKNFERELPEGYEVVFHINAKNKKTGIILNAVALVIYVALTIAAIFAFGAVTDSSERTFFGFYFGFVIGVLFAIAYIVIHELTHGLAYKILTGEKLTFGMSWSCAFCGVPNIYVYRKTLLIACLLPFVIYTVVFSVTLGVCLAIAAFCTVKSVFALTIVYTAVCTVFALHLGGCAGDLFVAWLLLFKYKNGKILARDTGPEQFIYSVKNQMKEESI